MQRQQQIRQALSNMAAKYGPLQTILATCNSYDESAQTCELQNDDDPDNVVTIPDVRLRPILDGKESITIFPTPGSWCVAIRIEDDEDWMLLAASEVDKYKINVNGLVFEIGNKATLNNGSNSLFTALNLIIDAVAQVIVIEGRNPDYMKLQQAKEQLNNILQ